MADINVAITLDKNYLQHAAVMLHSMIENNKSNSIRIFAICDEQVSIDDWSKLGKVYENSNLKVEKVKIDKSFFANFKISDHASLANYYRIQMAELVPKEIDKILYLDVDIVVKGDLSELYNINIDGYQIAAIEDPLSPHKYTLGLTDTDAYFNSGILLMNLAVWRKVGLYQQLCDFVIKNEHLIKYWDQDAFNVVCKQYWKPLAPKYNLQTPMFTFKTDAITYTYQQIQEAIKNPLIIHYTGKSKPWQYMDKHPRKKDYYQYLKGTPWQDYKAPDDTLGNKLRKLGLMPGFMENILNKR